MASLRERYLAHVAQGLTPKQAAKLVQQETGLSARTGKPLKQQQNSVEIYNAYNKGKGYLGQYGRE